MIKYLSIFIIFLSFSSNLYSKQAPYDFADLVENLSPAVVSIASKTIVKQQDQPDIPKFPEGSPFDEFFKDYFNRRQQDAPTQRPMFGLGSGFIIDSSGIIVTNNHVIESADEITIIMSDKTEFEAELLGRDPKADLAVLKIDPKDKELVSVPWGNSDKLRVGNWTIAIGNPLGLGGTVTAGIVSAISRDIGNGPYVKFIQTDASINRGNSGGPLFNIDGEVIGINSAIISQTGGSIGLGFAIPSNSAKKIINQLIEFGRTKRGWLGVQITPVTDDIAESLGLESNAGAFVSNLNPDGPAKKSGIQEGDVIIKFNNNLVESMTDLPKLVAESDVGSIALVEVWRKNKSILIEVELGELEEETFVNRSIVKENKENIISFDELGLSIKKSIDDKGVVVVKSDESSNLLPDDIIIEVNREKISSIKSFKDLISTIKETGRSSILLKILREKQSLWVTLKFKN
tara:strand:+ start:470 stop:1849 length:1380 start_codon:yes stop_codon:yes gene_type:complete